MSVELINIRMCHNNAEHFCMSYLEFEWHDPQRTAWECTGRCRWETYRTGASPAMGSRRSPWPARSCPARPRTESDTGRWAGPGTPGRTASRGTPACLRGSASPGGAPSCPPAAWPQAWFRGPRGLVVSSSCSPHYSRAAGQLGYPHTAAAWHKSGRCGNCPIASCNSRIPPLRPLRWAEPAPGWKPGSETPASSLPFWSSSIWQGSVKKWEV